MKYALYYTLCSLKVIPMTSLLWMVANCIKVTAQRQPSFLKSFSILGQYIFRSWKLHPHPHSRIVCVKVTNRLIWHWEHNGTIYELLCAVNYSIYCNWCQKKITFSARNHIWSFVVWFVDTTTAAWIISSKSKLGISWLFCFDGRASCLMFD